MAMSASTFCATVHIDILFKGGARNGKFMTSAIQECPAEFCFPRRSPSLRHFADPTGMALCRPGGCVVRIHLRGFRLGQHP